MQEQVRRVVGEAVLRRAERDQGPVPTHDQPKGQEDRADRALEQTPEHDPVLQPQQPEQPPDEVGDHGGTV